MPLGHGKYNSGSRKWELVKYSFKRQKGASVSSALVLITTFFFLFRKSGQYADFDISMFLILPRKYYTFEIIKKTSLRLISEGNKRKNKIKSWS